MFDPESEIFDTISKYVKTKFPKAYVVGEYVENPSSFPCVTITCSENQVVKSRRDLRAIEHAALLLFDVNVYTNQQTGKKAQAKEIQMMIDEQFEKMGFTRVTMQQMANLANGTIFRLFSRYQGIDEPYNDGEDTVHFIFGVH